MNPEEVKKKLDEVGCGFCLAKWTQVTIHLGTGMTHSCHHPDPHKIPVEEIIKNLSRSNLRGLGGAGFPTAKKWEIVRQQPAPRVLVVNIDEGEPGTFKDRFFLEKDPHRFLEGALIASLFIKASNVYIYMSMDSVNVLS